MKQFIDNPDMRSKEVGRGRGEEGRGGEGKRRGRGWVGVVKGDEKCGEGRRGERSVCWSVG